MNDTRQAFLDELQQLTTDEQKEVMKAFVIIKNVSREKSAQLVSLRESGLTLDQIADMWGVELGGGKDE